MADSDLDAIRQARLQQLREKQQNQQGQARGSSDDDKKAREADARSTVLGQILTPEAADRLARIRLVKEERATDVENRLIMLARSGRLQQKVTEQVLIDLLNSINEQEAKEAPQKVVVTRRRGWDDDDDDLLDI